MPGRVRETPKKTCMICGSSSIYSVCYSCFDHNLKKIQKNNQPVTRYEILRKNSLPAKNSFSFECSIPPINNV